MLLHARLVYRKGVQVFKIGLWESLSACLLQISIQGFFGINNAEDGILPGAFMVSFFDRLTNSIYHAQGSANFKRAQRS